jgi:hypothetical protein
MATVIGSALVLTQQPPSLDPNNGLLCWQNIVTPLDITTTSETPENPKENLANTSTSFAWQASSTADQDIDIQIGNRTIDFIGIAGHNLIQEAEIRVQYIVDGQVFTVFDFGEFEIRSQALLFVVNEASPDTVRLTIRNNNQPPRIAVLYAGQGTRIERPIYVGHTPITMGSQITTIGSISESGQYLGEIIRREKFTTNVQLQNLTPQFMRDELLPFFQQRPRRPAFWAWRPEKYAAEVGYCWLVGNPRPVNQRGNGMMQVSFDLDAIV